jgi:hypothetical protein
MAAVFRGSEAEEDGCKSDGNGRKLFQRLTGDESKNEKLPDRRREPYLRKKRFAFG